MKPGTKTSLDLVAAPEAYFRELITDTLGEQKLKVAPETEFYLVNLLNQFMKAEKLYRQDADGAKRAETLALLVKEALEQPSVREQSQKFRHLGDVSLYTAGFFQDSLNRKLVDVDYYIGVGGTAYREVAERTPETQQRQMYDELAKRFGDFVEVLANISDRTQIRSEVDLLRLYEVWVRTGSERAAKALSDAGIIPNPTVPNPKRTKRFQ